MKIKRFAYENKATGWQLTPVEFGDFNLLVGASGVGKSQILKAIHSLKEIMAGKSLSGVWWEIDFMIAEQRYNWSGEFENIGYHIDFSTPQLPNDNRMTKRPKIIQELLSKNEVPIFERNHSETKIKGQIIPFKINEIESGLKIFNDDDIALIQHHFNKMSWQDTSSEIVAKILISGIHFVELKETHHTLDDIRRNNNIGSYLKLALIHEKKLSVLEDIKSFFISMFPSVEDIKFAPLEQDGMPFFVVGFPWLWLKEKHVPQWIFFNQISAGMLKTLFLIADKYIWEDETILLIDEFENSMGINCIDILEEFIHQGRKIQYIITSHHPYIINHVPMAEWKIVTRHGGTVTVREAHEFRRLSAKKLDSFTQLINLPEYNEGVTAE